MFPNGVEQYLIGGVLIGLGTALMFVWTGKLVGVSTFFTSTFSFISKQSFFQMRKYVDTRNWRFVFVIGLLIGAFLYAFMNDAFFTTDVQAWRMFVGGILVGIGTRMSGGCTSGHGICGMSAGSTASIYAVITFLMIAMGTALFVQSLGVTP